MIKFRSITFKLILAFLLVGIVPQVVAGFFAVSSTWQNLEKQIGSKLLLLADAKEGQVFAYLDALESRTLDFSSDGFIRDSPRHGRLMHFQFICQICAGNRF